MDRFDIPVALFIFKRIDTTLEIIDRIKSVAPKKIYLLGDDGRNEDECKQVEKCRAAVEERIDWDCEVIKNYACGNRGVYANIGLGAKWVLEREPCAIFVEDDNLPEVSFFAFCKELLEKYREDERILWICGTNYLGTYNSSVSYMFTHHMLPCGWASWSHKFLKYYDGELEHLSEADVWDKFSASYRNKPLCRQNRREVLSEYARRQSGNRFKSWDYQMNFSLRYYNLLGISPANNQIKNIGVDDFSTHGGNSYQQVMTKRFCSMESYPIEFPLKHPSDVAIDKKYEEKIDRIILKPLSHRIYASVCRSARKLLGGDIYLKLRNKYRSIGKK